ncbi:MAG: alkaline phosphatase family protein [Nitrospirota bacterium]|nr:alkaline phosphatase family protein [Nitrospirota bacterium]
MERNVAVIGLDCATPQLIFGEWRDHLPNLRRLMDSGVYGELESIIPPITVPAWTCMVTGKDPGELGIYGFRNRKDYSYDGLSIATSRDIKADTVWDIIARKQKKSILVGVPQTYPPREINGCMVSCFLTPSPASQYTYPPTLKEELIQVAGEYILDVPDFRSENKQQTLNGIYDMTRQRFKVAKHLVSSREWDFFMMVEMGTDRIHHAFWRYFDKEHRLYEKGNPFENAVLDYYKYVDQEIGELLAVLGPDTTVLIVSDHGAKKMDGAICINEWLMQNGYLTLKTVPTGITPLNKSDIDWDKTIAWGEGGYYSRVFLNVKGREKQGVIVPEEYESVRDQLREKLESLGDEAGRPIGTKVYKPQELYEECRGIPPDLIVVLGNLFWRAAGSVGHGRIHIFENDTGPDDANHAQNGIFIMSNKNGTGGKGTKKDNLHLMDIAPTVLNLLGMPEIKGLSGKAIEI